MELECQPRSIEQWYEKTTNLDRNWREKARRGEIEEEERNRNYSSKAEHKNTGAVSVSSVAQKTRDPSTEGTSRTCSNGRSRKNKCSYYKPKAPGRICI